MRIVVIGAGVMGTTTAYFLAEAGHQVTVVDRAPEPAAECSFANGAMLHASHTEPWNSPAAIGQLLRWIGREDSPLLLRPSQIPSLVGWGLGFLRHSLPARHRASTLVNTRLAVYSQQVLDQLLSRLSLDFDHRPCGILKVFRSAAELDAAARVSELIASRGVRFELVDAARMVELEPAFAPVRDQLEGGIFYPDDAVGDTQAFTAALARRARELGAEFRMDTVVRGLNLGPQGVGEALTEAGPLAAERFVLAAGAQAGRLARPLGLRLPIRPVKGYSATLPRAGLPGAPVQPYIDDARKVVVTPLGEQLRLAGTAEFAGFDDAVNERRVGTVMRQALELLPEYRAAVAGTAPTPWACLRPMTVDGPPILGPTRLPNLFLNAGSGHLGWTFAAGAGRLVADLVIGREPELDLEGLTLTRFGG